MILLSTVYRPPNSPKWWKILLSLVYRPPVFIEDSVTKAQQLSDDVEAGVEQPVEEYQPDKMIRHLTVVQMKITIILLYFYFIKTYNMIGYVA